MIQEKRLHAAAFARQVVTSEPLADGDGEAHLGAIDDFLGKVFARDLAEEALALAAGHKLFDRCGERSAREIAIEEWASHFQAAGHRGGIDFAEEVARKIVLNIN